MCKLNITHSDVCVFCLFFLYTSFVQCQECIQGWSHLPMRLIKRLPKTKGGNTEGKWRILCKHQQSFTHATHIFPHPFIHTCPFIAQERLDSTILKEHHVTRKLLIWVHCLLFYHTLHMDISAGANYFILVRPLHAVKCEQGREVWGHAPPGKFFKLVNLRSLLRPCLGQKSY